MPSRRGNGNLRSRAGKFRLPVVTLLLVSVVTPLVFLAARLGNFTLSGSNDFSEGSTHAWPEDTKLIALQQIESLFPKEVLHVIRTNTDDSGPLSLNVIGRKDLSSSWVVEKPGRVSRAKGDSLDVQSDPFEGNENETKGTGKGPGLLSASLSLTRREALDVHGNEEISSAELVEKLESKDGTVSLPPSLGPNSTDGESTAARAARQLELGGRGVWAQGGGRHSAADKHINVQTRAKRKDKRVLELTRMDKAAVVRLEEEVMGRKKEIDDNVQNSYSIWRPEFDAESDTLVRLIRDQLIMARVYASLAHSHNMIDLQRELNLRIKESRHVLGEANLDSDLPRSASEKIKLMGQALSTARKRLYDCKAVTKKLRAMLQTSEDQAHALNKQSAVLRQLVAKTIPKGIHCLSMLLTSEYNSLLEDQRELLADWEKLEDSSLFHYALFSDNVIAAAVVVNSTVQNAKEPEKHVFHLVSDRLNYAAMKMWFIANPPGRAIVHVENVDDFKWLNATYCPVLRQLQTATMKEYYFKSDHPTTLADASTNLKYRNPKYLSMLNHLRFYLPEVYPKLNKILFLDDDIVVQKDLTPLWSVDLHGNVNGAVETCGATFHRFDKYLNFSNPLISENFDPNACGWAYGMNMFDLKEWKKRDITGIYHKWQNLNEGRELWKLGTLPPGLITFYNLTHPLDKSWHVLGLGYDPHVERDDIEKAAVVHYNGNMKPWLDLSMSKYKPYWTKYVNYSNFFLQQCNVNV